MDHLRRLCFTIPSSLYALPDGAYGDIEAFLNWLEGQSAHEQITAWEQRQCTILTGIINHLEAEKGHTGQSLDNRRSPTTNPCRIREKTPTSAPINATVNA